jgi:hypothetical protein
MTRPAGKPLRLASENCPLDTFRSSSYGIPVACTAVQNDFPKLGKHICAPALRQDSI